MSETKIDSTFRYTDQLDQNSLRLLQVELVGDHQSGKLILSCQLQTFPCAESPKYIALSYAWNEPLSECDDYLPMILLGGYQTFITPNLYEALRQLTDMGIISTGSFWWIDALCINQTDQEEQSSQVSIMHNIFRNAETVIVWLGADFANEAYQVREFLRALLAQFVDEELEHEGKRKYQLDFLYRGEAYDSNGLPDLSSPIWKYVVDFWDRAWFYRTWVLQEVAVANRIEMYCGSVWFAVRELTLVSRFHVHSNLGEALMLLRDGQDPLKSSRGRKVGSSALKIDDVQLFAKGIPFQEADDFQEMANRLTGPMSMANHPCLRIFAVQLFLARREKATNPKDKVFALLVLMKQITESYKVDDIDLEVDYSKPFSEVYQEGTAWLILESGCLGILGIVSPDQLLSDRPGGCSWIPDFTEEPMQPLRVFGKPDPRIVTNIPDPELSPGIREYSLYISAKYHSIVTDIGDTFKSMIDDGCYESSARTLLNCPLIMPKHNNLSRIEIWRRTLSGISAYEIDPNPSQSRSDFHDFLAFYTLRAVGYAKNRGLVNNHLDIFASMTSLELLAQTDDSDPRSLPRWEFWKDVTTVNRQKANALLQKGTMFPRIEISGRRLFRMDSVHGVYLGYGPEIMQEGDQVWFAAGAALPLVLRPLEPDTDEMKTYAFVGEAYMIDIVDMIQELSDCDWQRLKIK